MKCNLTIDQLKKIFDNLNNKKKRIEVKRKNDFVKLFLDENVVDWKRIKWEGSNPELATLILKLTGKDPIPSLVNKYFEPKVKYKSNSYKRRQENHAIKTIINTSKK